MVNVCITYKPQASRTEWRNKQYLVKTENSKCLWKVRWRFSCGTVYPTVKILVGILLSGCSELFWPLTRINGPSRGADCRLVTYREDTKKQEKHDSREQHVGWEINPAFPELFFPVPCSSVNSTFLPISSTNPTLHCPMGLHHLQLQMLSYLFLRDALWFETVV